MQIHRDNTVNQYVIQRFEPGLIVINQSTYDHSLIVTQDQLLPHWRPCSFEDLRFEDLALLQPLKPELILLGTGEKQHFPNPSFIEPFLIERIGVECMTTASACRTFNVLQSEGRNVVAALILR